MLTAVSVARGGSGARGVVQGVHRGIPRPGISRLSKGGAAPRGRHLDEMRLQLCHVLRTQHDVEVEVIERRRRRQIRLGGRHAVREAPSASRLADHP